MASNAAAAAAAGTMTFQCPPRSSLDHPHLVAVVCIFAGSATEAARMRLAWNAETILFLLLMFYLFCAHVCVCV